MFIFTDLLENTVFDLQSEFSQISSMFDGMQNVKFSNREVMSEQANMTSYSVYNYRTCKNSDGFCFMNVISIVLCNFFLLCVHQYYFHVVFSIACVTKL